jgi:hypothetical protein
MKLNNSHLGFIIILAFYIFTLFVNFKGKNPNIDLSIGLTQLLIYSLLSYLIGLKLSINKQSKVLPGLVIGFLLMMATMTIGEIAKMQIFHFLNTR